jgi:GNAT superfamily N-acetyltransferase
VAYLVGAPAGYVQLAATVGEAGTEVEVLYFGLMEHAIGRGVGGALLTEGLRQAWGLAARAGLPAARKVWLHTCSLDGPQALKNYQARGLQIVRENVEEMAHMPDETPGSWTATTGLSE